MTQQTWHQMRGHTRQRNSRRYDATQRTKTNTGGGHGRTRHNAIMQYSGNSVLFLLGFQHALSMLFKVPRPRFGQT